MSDNVLIIHGVRMQITMGTTIYHMATITIVTETRAAKFCQDASEHMKMFGICIYMCIYIHIYVYIYMYIYGPNIK